MNLKEILDGVGRVSTFGPLDKEITALTAYLQRLGTDIKWRKVAPQAPLAPATTTAPAAVAGK